MYKYKQIHNNNDHFSKKKHTLSCAGKGDGNDLKYELCLWVIDWVISFQLKKRLFSEKISGTKTFLD